ncbi:alpha/beta hydrolase [Nocardia cyriacigeorgica]|uniref:alpha/beta hydrolase n=1 Tax=Nocardia cyriacigeorgica TaxID=135487 RepID=UPI0018935987|nr:alpha/beta hydrolase [Nocardia cyriacigeorgica]MBF6428109.1 alpha/beta hydrolase [Nocardia cyriacigeorgica]
MRLGLDDLIDPRLRLLADESRGFYENRPPGRGPRDFEELRAVRAGAGDPAPVDPPAVDEVVEAEGRSVPVRVHAPAGGVANGVFLEFHGGGFYMGSAAGSDVRNRRLADALGVAVVSVDYRLAPEHPWPAAPDDGETAALWLVEHAAQRFGTRKLAVGGFSAGSTLAMTTLLRLRDRGINAFDCAVLQFGTYDLSTQTPAGRLIADEYFLEAYAGTAPDRTHPDISPIYAELGGLPSVLMVVGEQDILLQDNLAMAARISAFGGNVDLRIYPEAPHGFTGHPTAMAKAALDDIETWVSGQLGARS